MTDLAIERITPAEFSRREGVAKTTVSRWIRDGRITLGSDGLLDPVVAHEERIATESPLPHHQANAAHFAALSDAKRTQPNTTLATPPTESPLAPDLTPSVPMSPTVEIAARLKYETYRLQKARADTANLELAKTAGALLDRDEVAFVLADFGATLQQFLTAFADRTTPAVLSAKDAAGIHRALEEAALGVLDDMSAAMRRRINQSLPSLTTTANDL